MDNLGKYVYAEQKRQEGTGYMKLQTVYLKCDRSAEVQAQAAAKPCPSRNLTAS